MENARYKDWETTQMKDSGTVNGDKVLNWNEANVITVQHVWNNIWGLPYFIFDGFTWKRDFSLYKSTHPDGKDFWVIISFVTLCLTVWTTLIYFHPLTVVLCFPLNCLMVEWIFTGLQPARRFFNSHQYASSPLNSQMWDTVTLNRSILTYSSTH